MKLEIEGLLWGRDVGYSVRHPDHNHLDEFCCCEKGHIHLPGETPAERHRHACLMIAAPEMLELIQALAVGYDEDDGQGIYQRVDDFIDFTHQAQALLAKIEGGEA